MEGIKRKRRCDSDCEDHILDIKASKGISSKYDFRQQFCPKYQREPMPPEQTYPQYNNDGKYYTTAFILGVDRRVLNKNDLQQIMDHQKLIRDSLQKHNQLVFPRPNSKHSLCSVCKEHYKNYYIHIASDEHAEKIGLSPYNQHILALCNRYIELWEGAQQKADEEAERRAAEDKIRRQKQEEERLQRDEEDDEDESLLDVERGENAQMEQDRDQDDQYGLYTVKPNQNKHKKKSRYAVYLDQDTVPLAAKPTKRSHPDGHHHQEYPRKKFVPNHVNPIRFFRTLQEKKYEKQRQKIKSGRDGIQNREFIAAPVTQGDLFLVMKMVHQISQNVQASTKRPNTSDKIKRQLERPIQNNQKAEVAVNRNIKVPSLDTLHFEINGKVRQLQIVYSKSGGKQADRADTDIRQTIKSKANQSQILESKEALGYKQSKIEKFPYHHQRAQNLDDRPYGVSSMSRPEVYKPMTQASKYIPETFKHVNQSYKYFHENRYPEIIQGRGQFARQNYKTLQDGYKIHLQNKSENYKQNPYNYYNPYMYGVYEPSYRDKGYEYLPNDKQKPKTSEKPYQYVSYSQWPYHPSPYYLPPVQGPAQQINSAQQTSDQPQSNLSKAPINSDQHNPSKPANVNNVPNPYVGGTSININFPMYMCPPPPHSIQGVSYSLPPSRYSMPPMMHSPYNMGYQYSQYASNQQPATRQPEYLNNQSQPHGITGVQLHSQGPQTQLSRHSHQLKTFPNTIQPNELQMPTKQRLLHPHTYQPGYLSHQYGTVSHCQHAATQPPQK